MIAQIIFLLVFLLCGCKHNKSQETYEAYHNTEFFRLSDSTLREIAKTPWRVTSDTLEVKRFIGIGSGAMSVSSGALAIGYGATSAVTDTCAMCELQTLSRLYHKLDFDWCQSCRRRNHIADTDGNHTIHMKPRYVE